MFPIKQAILCLLLLVFFWASDSIAQEPVKVGFLFWMSGRTGAAGELAKNGAQVALQELNKSGGIQGRKLVAFFADSQGDPKIAGQAFAKLVKDKGVNVVIGVQADEVAPVLADLALQYKVPLIITEAQSNIVTGGKCNRYTFRICLDNRYNARIGAILAGRTDAKKWTACLLNNTEGRELWSDFKAHFRKIKPDAVFLERAGEVFVDKKSPEWKRNVTGILKSDAQGVLVSLDSTDFVDFIKFGNSQGLFNNKREFVVLRVSPVALFALGFNMPAGIWCSSPYQFNANGSPINMKFVGAYKKAFGFFPSWHAHFAYAGVKAYAEAAYIAGSLDANPIIDALEHLKIELPLGKVTIRGADHQAIMHSLGGRTGRVGIDRNVTFRDLENMTVFRAKEFTQPGEEKVCSR